MHRCMCLRMHWREVYVLMGTSDRMNIRVMVRAYRLSPCPPSEANPILANGADQWLYFLQSIQLPFALLSVLHFTSSPKLMGKFDTVRHVEPCDLAHHHQRVLRGRVFQRPEQPFASVIMII